MHEVGDASSYAVLWSIFAVIVGAVYVLVRHQVKASEARYRQILKLQELASEEADWAERQAAEEFKIVKALKSSKPPKKEATKVALKERGKISEDFGRGSEFDSGRLSSSEIDRVVERKSSEDLEISGLAKVILATGQFKEFGSAVEEFVDTHQEAGAKEREPEVYPGTSSPTREESVFRITVKEPRKAEFTNQLIKAEEESPKICEAAQPSQLKLNLSHIQCNGSSNETTILSEASLTQLAPDSTSAVVRPQLSVSRSIRGPSVCAVCASPTNKQCSRCKAVKYCSYQCQFHHWYKGHKDECSKVLGSPTSPPSSNTASNSQKLGSPGNLSPSPVKEEKLHSNRVLSKETSTSVSANTPQYLESVVAANGSLLQQTLPLVKVNTPQSLKKKATTNGSSLKSTRILFPYDQFIQLFMSDEVRLAPCGLINSGNSCFANVVLQCLIHTQPLAAYLLEGYHLQECHRKGWCFMCELQHLVSRVKDSQVPFSPVGIVSKIPNIGNHMRNDRQEDAHEFMRFAIDSMQSCCLDKVGGEKAINQQTQETSFIQHTFGGHLRSQVKCMQCNHESYKFENMMDLTVEIHGNVDTIEDALARFTASEWLDGDNKYRCERCGTYVKAWKRLLIHESPNVLTIALKRFQWGKFGKLNKRVVFPSVLNMTPFMSNKCDKPPCYELYGVIVHIDMLNSSFFGHYISYVKDFNGFWYKIDDSQVKEVNLEDVLQQRAYMLLYKRSTPRSAPLTSTCEHSQYSLNMVSSEAMVFSYDAGHSQSKLYRSANVNGAVTI